MATSAGGESVPAEGSTTVTGGSKPLHRFLRGEPKCVGVVLMFLGSSLIMFGIPQKTDVDGTSADVYSPFWLGILYFTSGLLYVLSERQPTKKIITISLALSIISILGSAVAALQFIRAMFNLNYHMSHENVVNETHLETVMQRYMPLYSLEAVFLFHSMVAVVILITMSSLARLALRSSRTQMVVVMRKVPPSQ